MEATTMLIFAAQSAALGLLVGLVVRPRLQRVLLGIAARRMARRRWRASPAIGRLAHVADDQGDGWRVRLYRDATEGPPLMSSVKLAEREARELLDKLTADGVKHG